MSVGKALEIQSNTSSSASLIIWIALSISFPPSGGGGGLFPSGGGGLFGSAGSLIGVSSEIGSTIV